MEKEKRIRGLADTLLILLITIVTGTILIMACGADPAEAYSLVVVKHFCNTYG